MKRTVLYVLILMMINLISFAQVTKNANQMKQEINSLIESYTEARETKDTVLLSNILTDDIDQLVSSGVWRKGKTECMSGMMRSSGSNPGTRTITVENIRFLSSESAVADAKYEIENADGTARKMWSTFIVVYREGVWKITAIRNMLPAG